MHLAPLALLSLPLSLSRAHPLAQSGPHPGYAPGEHFPDRVDAYMEAQKQADAQDRAQIRQNFYHLPQSVAHGLVHLPGAALRTIAGLPHALKQDNEARKIAAKRRADQAKLDAQRNGHPLSPQGLSHNADRAYRGAVDAAFNTQWGQVPGKVAKKAFMLYFVDYPRVIRNAAVGTAKAVNGVWKHTLGKTTPHPELEAQRDALHKDYLSTPEEERPDLSKEESRVVRTWDAPIHQRIDEPSY
ncbi:MAG: hypothetical protein M1826_007392 [Phylliscum demangeonii]|nr:MAG: hypothetical protein M1826_007392 [Phylliscum demangeonii]